MGLKNSFDLALVSVDFSHDSTAVFVSCFFLFLFYQYQRKFKCAFNFCLSDSRLIFAWFLLVFCLFFSLIFAWFLLVFCLYFFISFCLFFACFFSKTNSKLKYDSDLSIMGTRQLSRNWLEVNWIFIRALADRKQGKGLIWEHRFSWGGSLPPHGNIGLSGGGGLFPLKLNLYSTIKRCNSRRGGRGETKVVKLRWSWGGAVIMKLKCS